MHLDGRDPVRWHLVSFLIAVGSSLDGIVTEIRRSLMDRTKSDVGQTRSLEALHFNRSCACCDGRNVDNYNEVV